MQVHHAMIELKGDASKLYDNLNVIKISTESVSKLGALGFVLSKTEDVPLQTRRDYEQKICELYGGMANEEIYYKEAGVTAGAHNDIQKVTEMLNVMFNEVGYYNSCKLNYGMLSKMGYDTHGARIEQIEEKAAELFEQGKAHIPGAGHLAELKPQRAAGVDDAAAVPLQPRQNQRRHLRRIPVTAGVGRGAHAVVEDAGGRRRRQVNAPFVKEPLLEGQGPLGQGLPQRLDPGRVFVKDENFHHALFPGAGRHGQISFIHYHLSN